MYHRGEEDAVRTKPTGDEITPLPPAPAPTARDANPWQTSGAAGPPKRMTSIRTPRGRDPVTRPAREGMRNLVAIGIIAFILVSGVLEALQGGGPEALIGMAVPLFILAILFLARRNKSKRRGRGDAGPGAGGD
jgi:hypothetical protein